MYYIKKQNDNNDNFSEQNDQHQKPMSYISEYVQAMGNLNHNSNFLSPRNRCEKHPHI